MIIKNIILMGIGDCGLGIGDWGIGEWGLGNGPKPQSPTPHPPSPNPKTFFYLQIQILILIINKTYSLFKIII